MMPATAFAVRNLLTVRHSLFRRQPLLHILIMCFYWMKWAVGAFSKYTDFQTISSNRSAIGKVRAFQDLPNGLDAYLLVS